MRTEEVGDHMIEIQDQEAMILISATVRLRKRSLIRHLLVLQILMSRSKM
jgi:hypothetical protein